MPKLKSQSHHWWPECVSIRWADAEGLVRRLSPDGDVKPAPPKNFGTIGNGHFIKIDPSNPEGTVWDESFEPEFDYADSNFPSVIDRLENLPHHAPLAGPFRKRFVAQAASDAQLKPLVACLVSLAVRGPRFREHCVGLAERLRGPLPKPERNKLIGLNMRRCQTDYTRAIGVSGKFAVIFSPNREFVFGDGFYHTFTSPSGPPLNPQIFVPLTPRVAVLYARPIRYSTEPRLCTLAVTADEAELLNHSVQTYSREWLFYRSEHPKVGGEFTSKAHFIYDHPQNPIANLIHEIPGLPERDLEMELLLYDYERRGDARGG